MDAVSEIAL